MAKSWVSMEKQVCVVCGKEFDTGALLLDKRMKQSMAPNTITGFGMCPEHKKLSDEGFVALVEIDPSKSISGVEDLIKPQDAYRTGNIAHIRASVLAQICDVKITTDVVYIEPGVIEKLKSIQEG
jgi:hypothetical protein